MLKPRKAVSNYVHFQPVADLMVQAGRTITEPMRRLYPNARYEIKEDNSPVTAADKAAETFITHGLRRILRGSYVLGEETCPIGRGWDSSLIDYRGPVWTVDPIDGTKMIIEGGEYGIMISLRHNRKTEAAWIYFPKTNEMLFASVADEHALHVTNFGTSAQHVHVLRRPPSRQSHDITLAHYPLEDRIFETHKLDRIFGSQREDKCIATDLRDMLLHGTCAVINQKVKTPWDFDSTSFIAHKAGAAVTRDIDGRKFRDRSSTIVFAPTERLMKSILTQIRAAAQPT